MPTSERQSIDVNTLLRQDLWRYTCTHAQVSWSWSFSHEQPAEPPGRGRVADCSKLRDWVSYIYLLNQGPDVL